MTRRSAVRATGGLIATTATLALVFVVASPARALPLPDPTSLTGSVTDAIIGDVLAPVADTGSGATKPVTDAVSPVTDPVKEATKPVTDAAGSVTGSGPAREVVDEADKATGGLVGGTAGAVDNVLDPGGTVTEDEKASRRAAASSERTRASAPGASGTSSGFVRERESGVGPTTERRALQVARTTSSSSSSTLTEMARTAVDAAKKLAFPLALMLLLAGFLTVQDRVDRRDPKLRLAPVDAEERLVSFE